MAQNNFENVNGVELILKNIAESGDKALLSYVKIFDNINIKSTELLADKKRI